MPTYTLSINRTPHTVEVEADTPLLWVLREHLQLTGTKYGCGMAQCGACTIHVNGNPVRSCIVPISSVKAEQEITTIEGLSESGDHPLQEAWVEAQVPQCGYCQSGQIMQAAALLAKNPQPDREEIIQFMNGNLCRCGTYMRIIKAIEMAAKPLESHGK
ncbi:MAG: (2Fe-2S)-binding protein [Bacteroidota bacterium]